jgi:hypothetical protein
MTVPAQDILDAALFARVVYGGESLPEAYHNATPNEYNDDDYKRYLATLGWTVPLAGTGDFFQANGLYLKGNSSGLLATKVDADGTVRLIL